MARQDAQLARDVVLALVVLTPRHGWAVHEELAPSGTIGRAWTLSRQLVYRAIDTLVADGLVKRATPKDGGGADKVLEALGVLGEGHDLLRASAAAVYRAASATAAADTAGAGAGAPAADRGLLSDDNTSTGAAAAPSPASLSSAASLLNDLRARLTRKQCVLATPAWAAAQATRGGGEGEGEGGNGAATAAAAAALPSSSPSPPPFWPEGCPTDPEAWPWHAYAVGPVPALPPSPPPSLPPPLGPPLEQPERPAAPARRGR